MKQKHIFRHMWNFGIVSHIISIFINCLGWIFFGKIFFDRFNRYWEYMSDQSVLVYSTDFFTRRIMTTIYCKSFVIVFKISYLILYWKKSIMISVSWSCISILVQRELVKCLKIVVINGNLSVLGLNCLSPVLVRLCLSRYTASYIIVMLVNKT